MEGPAQGATRHRLGPTDVPARTATGECMRVRRYILIACILTGLLSGTIRAQEESELRLEVRPILLGRFVPGQATMLRVYLENEGPDLEGYVEVEVDQGNTQGFYHIPLSLPRQSRKEVPVYIGPVSEQSSFKIEVRFVTGRQVQAETSISLQPLQPNDLVIGLLAEDPSPLSFLPSIRAGSTLVPLDILDIPEQAWPLRNLDVIIVAGTDTSGLSPDQRRALAQWVRTGGHLVVSGGPNAPLSLSGFEEILPISLEGDTSLGALPNLERAVQEEIPPSGPYLASRVSVHGGVVLLSEQELPLIVSQINGLGQVTFLALDPTMPPLRSWAGNESLWRTLLLDDPRPDPWHRKPLEQPFSLANPLAESIGLRLPSMVAVGGLLLLYIVLVGPVNYIVLKRRQQLELAWLTIPLLTVVFALGVYGLGSLTRGGQRSLSIISVVRMASGGQTALVESYAGLFSPHQQSYDLASDGDALFGPLPPAWSFQSTSAGGPFYMLQQERNTLDDFRVEQWSMRTFAVQTLLDPAPDIWAEVSYDGAQVQGTFYNGTAEELQYCMLMGRPSASPQTLLYASLDNLPAGTQVSRSRTLYSTSGYPSLPSLHPLQYGIMQAIFGYAFQENLSDTLALICWAERGSLSLELQGDMAQEQRYTLYVIALGIQGLATRAGAFQPGPVLRTLAAPSWTIVESTNDPPTCEGGFLPGMWEAVLEYQLPVTTVSELTGMEFNLVGSDWDPLPEVYFQHSQGHWLLLGQPPEGTISIQEVQLPLFVDYTSRIVRVRLVSTSKSGGCLQPVLKLRGGAP